MGDFSWCLQYSTESAGEQKRTSENSAVFGERVLVSNNYGEKDVRIL